MGTMKLRLNEWAENFVESLDTRLEAFAEIMVDDAQARAPVRKTTAGRRRGRLSAFVPVNKTQGLGTYHFGNVKLTSTEIAKAASRIGVNLGTSARLRANAGKGPLLIQERRPGRRQKRADYRVPRNFYITSEDGVVQTKARPSVVISQRTARQVDELTKKRAAVMMDMTYNTRTGEFEEDTQPGRLRRSIYQEHTSESQYHIRYTIRAGAPYARYVEFPTSRTRAQPFLLPALKNARSRLHPWMKGRGR